MSDFAKKFAKKPADFQRSYLRKVKLMAEEGQTEKFCNTLTKFDFLAVKISHKDFGVQSLISDYDLANDSNLALSEEIKDNLKLIQGAIRISANVIADDPSQLPSQLLGRLMPYKSIEDPDLNSKSWIKILLKGMITYWKHPPEWLKGVILFNQSLVFYIIIFPLLFLSEFISNKNLLSIFSLIIGLLAIKLNKVIDLLLNLLFKLIFLYPFFLYQVFRLSQKLSRKRFGKAKPPEVFLINVLLDQVENYKSQPWLRPLTPSLTPSGDSLIRTIQVHNFNPHNKYNSVNTIAITPDGTKVISDSMAESLMFWDINTGTPLKILTEYTGSVEALAITPDGKQIVLGSSDKTITVWNIETGQSIATFSGHQESINAIAITPDGKKVVSASHDTTLKVWDLQTGQCLCTCREHKKSVNVVAIHPYGDKVISGDDDRMLILWDLKNGQIIKQIKVFENDIKAIKIIKNGQRILVLTLDNTFEICDISTGKVLKKFTGEFTGYSSRINDIAITSDETKVVAASNEQTVKIWDLRFGVLLGSFEGHYADVTAVAITPDDKQVVSGSISVNSESMDMTLKIWDLTSISKTSKTKSLTKHIGSVKSLAITPDRKRAISGCSHGNIIIWDIGSKMPIKTLEAHNKEVTSIAITPDGQKFVSASLDKVVRIWNLHTGKIIGNLLPGQEVRALAITSDSKYIVSGLDDGDVIIWDLDSQTISRKLSHDLDKHSGSTVMTLAITPDGKHIITGKANNSLLVWDFKSGNRVKVIQVLNEWKIHADGPVIQSIAVTPDSKQLISASSDESLRLWDIAHGTELKNFPIHTGFVNGVAITPSGQLAVSVSSDETVKVWYLQTGEIVANISVETEVSSCAVTSDDLTDDLTIVAGDFSGRVHFLRLPGVKHINNLSNYNN